MPKLLCNSKILYVRSSVKDKFPVFLKLLWDDQRQGFLLVLEIIESYSWKGKVNSK